MEYNFLDTDGKPALTLEPTENQAVEIRLWINGFRYTLSKRTAKTMAKALNQLTKASK